MPSEPNLAVDCSPRCRAYLGGHDLWRRAGGDCVSDRGWTPELRERAAMLKVERDTARAEGYRQAVEDCIAALDGIASISGKQAGQYLRDILAPILTGSPPEEAEERLNTEARKLTPTRSEARRMAGRSLVSEEAVDGLSDDEWVRLREIEEATQAMLAYGLSPAERIEREKRVRAALRAASSENRRCFRPVEEHPPLQTDDGLGE